MARQNLQTLKASVGWRTLDPGAYTFDTTSALEVSENRNLSGLDLGQLYELNTRLRLRNFSSIFLAADFAPARFDDREIGTPDSALERAHYLGGRLELASDPRGLFYVTLANQTQVMGAGIYSTGVQASFVLHALRQLDIELLPQLTWAAGEYRYARQVTVPTNDFFGKLTAKSLSATLRATYTFTPQLTLQAYTQAFLASGHYERPSGRSRPAPVRLSQLTPLAALVAADRGRLRGRRAQRERGLPLGVPARFDDLFRVHALTDSDGADLHLPCHAEPGRVRARRLFGRRAAQAVVLVGELMGVTGTS